MAACGKCGEGNPPSANFCLACGAPLARAAPAPASARKTVTVLFCDVAESTRLGERLDPEALRGVMGRWFESMRDVVERHGGIVEKFVGDAVMAVFGVPRVNEDDALRAVRAAADMRAAVADLNEELGRTWDVRLQVRFGLNTGEVVAGDSGAGQTLVTGDAVNTAKRLEQAAHADEILLGRTTKRLVENAIVAEPRAPVAAKGKAEPVEAWSLRAVIAGAPGFARKLDTRLVGRAAELAQLEQELAATVSTRTCRLVTVLGPAGIGKSRLAAELARRADADMLTARCLPYGEGITFWPLAQLVAEAGGEEALLAALGGESDSELIFERICGVVGSGSAVSTEEAFWAVRRLLETLARRRPLVVCLDDVHWAEPTFLDLVEYVAGWSRDAPLLLVCLARPDLLDNRPTWLSGPTAALTLRPLNAEESETLLDELTAEWPLPAPARARVREAAEGNPLFVEQLVAMLAENDGAAEVSIPPTIHALLAARLDRLTEVERPVVERASVLGKEFTRGGVLALTPDPERGPVGAALLSLVRRDLIQPDATSIAGDDGFRFRHVLIRDAAYAGIPKEVRSELHERAAGWLTDDEIVGYHLEQAFLYRRQLGPLDAQARALAAHGGALLGEAGHRAFLRDDMPAAAGLLARSLELVPESALERRRDLCSALFSTGRVSEAEALLEDVIATAARHGDRRAEWFSLLQRAAHRSVSDPDAVDELMGVAEQAVRVFEELGDDAGLARAWRQISSVHRLRCSFGAAEQASELALEHARRCADRQEEARLADELCTALLFGPTPAGDAIGRCEAMLVSAEDGSVLQANVFASLAGLRGMRGDFAVARDLAERARRIYSEFGLRFALAGLSQVVASVEVLSGRPEVAEADLREGLATFGDLGARGLQAAHLAHALLAQGRADAAAPYVEVAENASGERDVAAQVLSHSARALLRAGSGEVHAAVDAAEAAVRLAAVTDAVAMHAEAALILADVSAAAGRSGEAATATALALGLFEEKGHAIGVRTTRARLAALAAAH